MVLQINNVQCLSLPGGLAFAQRVQQSSHYFLPLLPTKAEELLRKSPSASGIHGNRF